MSIYLAIDGDEPAFFASNQGWAEASAWVFAQPTDELPELVHLVAHGWVEPAGKLAAELAGVQPDHPDTVHVLAEMRSLLAGADPDAAVTVTNGLAPDDAPTDEE